MKKSIKVLVLFMLMVSVVFTTVAFASNEVKVVIDGEYVEFDVKPQIINDRTMVPLRAIFEALGAEVDWQDKTQTVIATKDDITVTATIGSKKMYIDNKEKIMDIAPMLVAGRTLVPVRFVAEAFDCEVDWDVEKNTVIIISNNNSTYNGLPENIINQQEE